MLGSKRFQNRQGLIISALGHLGLLAVGLLYLGASVHNAVPPDATLVELVTPQEIPRFSGTPSALRNSGTQTQAKPQPPVRPQKASPQTEQKQQQEQKEQRDAERDAPPKAKAPPLTRNETGEVAAPPEDPPLDPPAPAKPTLDAPATVEQRAQEALLGGRLGGGFNAPPIDSPLVGYDFTEPFRRVVSACSPPVPSVSPREQVSIRIRVFLNRDGTLTKAPLLREANPSDKQEAMMQSFVAGLEKCQPYTMMPPEKYAQWKVIDLVVFPINSYGG
jgi:hypothetical protein